MAATFWSSATTGDVPSLEPGHRRSRRGLYPPSPITRPVATWFPSWWEIPDRARTRLRTSLSPRQRATQQGVGMGARSKYPPAKPGALGIAPLKAASIDHAHYTHSLTNGLGPISSRAFARARMDRYTTFAPCNLSGLGCRVVHRKIPSRVRGGSTSGASIDGRLPEMSNFCCLPGRAGGPPLVG